MSGVMVRAAADHTVFWLVAPGKQLQALRPAVPTLGVRQHRSFQPGAQRGRKGCRSHKKSMNNKICCRKEHSECECKCNVRTCLHLLFVAESECKQAPSPDLQGAADRQQCCHPPLPELGAVKISSERETSIFSRVRSDSTLQITKAGFSSACKIRRCAQRPWLKPLSVFPREPAEQLQGPVGAGSPLGTIQAPTNGLCLVPSSSPSVPSSPSTWVLLVCKFRQPPRRGGGPLGWRDQGGWGGAAIPEAAGEQAGRGGGGGRLGL